MTEEIRLVFELGFVTISFKKRKSSKQTQTGSTEKVRDSVTNRWDQLVDTVDNLSFHGHYSSL